MAISIRIIALAVALISGASVALAGQAQQAQIRVRPVVARELPPKMTQRFSAFRSVLQPSARAWMEQQAVVEARKGAPDVKALEGAIRNRFPQLATGGISLAGSDIEAMVFIVMMQATQDMDQDLRNIMEQVKSIDNAKESLRSLQSGITQEIGRSGGRMNSACRSAFCRSLRSRLGELSASTAKLPRPVRFQEPAGPTYAELQTIQGSLKSQSDSMNEMSEMMSLRLQAAMDRRSKFIQALSNIEKKTSDTSAGIVNNLK